jgi:hypothetical protein
MILGFVDRRQVTRSSHLNGNVRDNLPKGPHVGEELCVPCRTRTRRVPSIDVYLFPD